MARYTPRPKMIALDLPPAGGKLCEAFGTSFLHPHGEGPQEAPQHPVQQGADRLGWTLEELMEKTILAMRSCEDAVNAAMETL